MDAVNKTMVSAGVDGLLVFWAFREKRADGAVAVGSGVSQLELVRGLSHGAAMLDHERYCLSLLLVLVRS